MKGYRALVAAALLVASWNCHAKTIFGQGVTTCGDYTESLKNPNQTVKVAAIQTWVFGYLSALNVTTLKNDVLSDTDGPAILGALKLYCERNPLSKVADGAFDVVVQLSERAEHANSTGSTHKPKK
jgi:hypothetical protein